MDTEKTWTWNTARRAYGDEMREAGWLDLTWAYLTDADLTGASLDFASWPLWCGSLGVRVDRKIAAQLAYHFCAVVCDDPDVIRAQNAILSLANEMHRTDVPRLAEKTTEGKPKK